MSYWASHFNRPISPEEQKVYNHLLELSQVEMPAQLIERFRWLFIEGVGYPDSEIQSALERLVASNTASMDFKFVLNRCCHILINRWQVYPRLQSAIADLVNIFEIAPSNPTYSRGTKRLRELVQSFTKTEQYATLRRLATVLDQSLDQSFQGQPLGNYIRRYPYLFEHCLLMEDSADEQRRTIRQMQIRMQQQFERDLSQYVTHRLLRSPSRQHDSYQEVKNPTLLSDVDLGKAIKQFAGKVDGRNTQRDLALHFLAYSNQARTYREFKHDLYHYLIASVDSGYGQHQFYDRLYAQLSHTLSDSDLQAPTEFLTMRTYSKLFNFLVVDNPQQPNHSVFLDLVMNIGTTLTINLLLKIVLLCQKVKPNLEKRFSILFNHYELRTKESGIGWLIDALENLNVAFATNFGSVNLIKI